MTLRSSQSTLANLRWKRLRISGSTGRMRLIGSKRAAEDVAAALFLVVAVQIHYGGKRPLAVVQVVGSPARKQPFVQGDLSHPGQS